MLRWHQPVKQLSVWIDNSAWQPRRRKTRLCVCATRATSVSASHARNTFYRRCMCLDRRCTMSGPFCLSSAKRANRSRSPWSVGPLHLRRLSHLYHLLEQEAGAPSEMLADPELQALARVAQTHISLLCTL